MTTSVREAKYISQTEYVAVVKAHPGGVQKQPTAFYDGQIITTATHDGSDTERNVKGSYRWIKRNAAALGDVPAIGAIKLQEDSTEEDHDLSAPQTWQLGRTPPLSPARKGWED